MNDLKFTLTGTTPGLGDAEYKSLRGDVLIVPAWHHGAEGPPSTVTLVEHAYGVEFYRTDTSSDGIQFTSEDEHILVVEAGWAVLAGQRFNARLVRG